MKRFLMCVAVLGLVAPALAEPTLNTVSSTNGATINTGTYDWDTQQVVPSAGDRAKFWQYTDTMTSGYYTNQATAPFVGDCIHELPVPGQAWPTQPGLYPSSITELMFGYYAPAAYNPGTSWVASILILDNPGGGDATMGATVAYFTAVLPLGGWFTTFDFQDAPIPKIGPDMWFLVGYMGLTDGGPLLSFNPGLPTDYGYSHDHFYKNGSLYWFGGLPYWADFVYAIRGIPEPMTIGLLAAGGLLVLRRRR